MSIPNNSSVNTTTTQNQVQAKRQCALAIAAFRSMDVKTALGHLAAALEADPAHAPSLLISARYYLDEDDLEQVEKFLDALEHFAPETPQLSTLRGDLFFRQGQIELAEQAYNEAVAKAPDSAEAILGTANILHARGELNEAASLFRHIIDCTTNFERAYDCLSKSLMPGPDYKGVLQWLHRTLNPETYIEVGVFVGESFSLANPQTRAIGIDPKPRLEFPISDSATIFKETSDQFFDTQNVTAILGKPTVDFAFIDGLHTFDQSLRDFINLEKYAGPQSIFVFHDCFPCHPTCAERERRTTFWTGDVWKVVPILKRYRPDLVIQTIKTSPSGLGFVTGMDPTSTVLEENFEAIVREYLALTCDEISENPGEVLNLVDNDWQTITQLLPTSTLC